MARVSKSPRVISDETEDVRGVNCRGDRMSIIGARPRILIGVSCLSVRKRSVVHAKTGEREHVGSRCFEIAEKIG
jgi:hypothetical protein